MIRHPVLSRIAATLLMAAIPLPACADNENQQPVSTSTAALSTPGMAGPLAANVNPLAFDAGPLGTLYVSGAVNALGLWQDNPAPGDRHTRTDISNGQVFMQKTDGLFQFYAQAGVYSLPALSTPYLQAGKTTQNFYGPLPQAFIKIAPTDSFSLEAGKLPTLVGAEYTFTFENMNIERGLLWNQENAVNRGVQANYRTGPFTLALTWNDGFYSNRYNWLWGSAAYTVNSADTVSVIAGGNTGRTSKTSLATPLAQNNSQLYNVIFTHTSGPWTIEPYLQYTYVPQNSGVGIAHEASTYGAALFVNYAFTPNFSLASRAEYIGSTGNAANGSPNLIYGPGSKAWSITVTPTYQYKTFFGRAELSFVGANDTTAGAALGPLGNNTTQTRLVLESGVLF